MSYFTTTPAACPLCQGKRPTTPRVMCAGHARQFRAWLRRHGDPSLWTGGEEIARGDLLKRWSQEQLLGPEGPPPRE